MKSLKNHLLYANKIYLLVTLGDALCIDTETNCRDNDKMDLQGVTET